MFNKISINTTPSNWFWFACFSISITGMFYLGLNPKDITKWWSTLFIYNLAMSSLALIFIYSNIRNLAKQASYGTLGSKLTWSFIKMVPLLSIVPLLSFYAFSFKSLQNSIQNIESFAISIQEKALNDTTKLAKNVELLRLEKYRDRTNSILNIILQNNRYKPNTNDYKNRMQAVADEIVLRKLACQIVITDNKNKTLAYTTKNAACPPSLEKPLYQEKNLQIYEKENIEFKNHVIGVNMSSHYIGEKDSTPFSVLVHYIVDDNNNQFLQQLSELKNTQLSIQINLAPLRRAFLIDMGSTMLLIVLSILVIISKMIRTLMLPLNKLSKATKEVSKGNYDVFIRHTRDDDARILIDLFNDMAKDIKISQHRLATQKVYLETILKYSYGVIALDENYLIKMLNPEVSKILHMSNIQKFTGRPYLDIVLSYSELKPLFEMINTHFDLGKNEWNVTIELPIHLGSILLSCQGARLEDEGKILGYVIILKDITELRHAQNKAAWAGVAMKMAHEVKNPLTPILLSAKRLRNKFLSKPQVKDANIIDKTTRTIMQQVQSIDTMISAFAEYTKTPMMEKRLQPLNNLISQVVALYEEQNNINIKLNLTANLPDLLLDTNSMQRVLINLIKNSIEAVHYKNNIKIHISSHTTPSKHVVKLIIVDNGSGFPDVIKDKIFEPYITTKSKGGGLGMAIVKSVLAEHNAKINISNLIKKDKITGARVEIAFKVLT